MADAILTDNDRKADLSFAYLAALAALAAKAGYTCQRGPQPDVDSIDATIRSGDPMRTGFDVQLKATSSPKRHEDGCTSVCRRRTTTISARPAWCH